MSALLVFGMVGDLIALRLDAIADRGHDPICPAPITETECTCQVFQLRALASQTRRLGVASGELVAIATAYGSMTERAGAPLRDLEALLGELKSA